MRASAAPRLSARNAHDRRHPVSDNVESLVVELHREPRATTARLEAMLNTIASNTRSPERTGNARRTWSISPAPTAERSRRNGTTCTRGWTAWWHASSGSRNGWNSVARVSDAEIMSTLTYDFVGLIERLRRYGLVSTADSANDVLTGLFRIVRPRQPMRRRTVVAATADTPRRRGGTQPRR